MKKFSFHLFVLLYLCMALHYTVELDSSAFMIYNEAHNKCAQVAEGNVVQAGDCDPTAETQRFRWISSSHLLSVSHKLCVGAQDLKEWVRVVLVPCKSDGLMQMWECKNETLFGLKGQSLHFNYGNQHEPNVLLYTGTGSWSCWQIYGTKQNLCSHGFEELFTIGGNAFGSPCQFPFKFGEKWYTECTLEGRADGQQWCATETDYNKDKRWGFCPSKSVSGWDSDPVTGVLYQGNTQSVLTWHQARKSCQQQDADLLSIVELHEQAYISGLTYRLGSALWIGLNSLDFESGWQWSNGNPFRYLNWAPGHPSLDPGMNCAALNTGKASKWETMECNKKLGYICRKGNSTAITPSIDTDQLSFCPVAWVPYAGNCYSLQRNKVMWKDALAACHKEGADLSSIHSIEEYSFLISQSGYLPTDELWIGLTDQKTQNLFEWSDRTHVSFAMWLVGEPSHAVNHREDCVLMTGKEGKWADQMCEKEHGYICKKRASRKPAGIPELVSPGCPTGWIRFSSFCYSIAVEAKTFNESKASCDQKGAGLVQVNDRYENAFLISQIGLRPEKYFWIGLSNTEQAERFEWTNKETVKFTHFNVGMPDEHQGCVAMLTGTSAGLWDVISCDQRQKYICKKIAEGVTTTKEPPTTQPLSCPSNWIKKDSANCIREYKNPVNNKKTWFEAHDFCRAIGGDLASFHSQKEIGPIPYSNIWNTAWIGLSSLDVNTGFAWTDGTPSNYENWNVDEPNDYNNNEHCVEMILQHGLKWNDRDCDAYNDWICQIRLGTTPEPPPTNDPQREFNITADGWIEFSGYQYFINQNALSMEDAREFCKKNRSDLIVITGQIEKKFIWKQISRTSENLYYIGMTVGLDKSFSWLDGSPVVYTAWNQNEPNFANNDENCVGMYKNTGFWNDINCGVALPSICKRSIDFAINTMAPVTAPTGGCAPEWISFEGKCYTFLGKGNEKTWHDAREYCISQGGNLVSIGSQAEQAFLTTMMLTTQDDVWIGLNDINWEMRFLWTDGKTVRFTNWAKGHPVSVPRERGPNPSIEWINHHRALIQFIRRYMENEGQFDCVVMVKETGMITGMWKVEDCKEKRGFICKMKTDSQIQVPVTTVSPLKYFALGNNSYKLQMEKMNWAEARRQCRADDADLASVLDTITQAFTTLRIIRSKQPVWIGLNSVLTEGRYHWIDNWMLRYVNWGKGEPSQNQACVYIDTDGYWKTANCSNTYYSLCKRSPDVAPTEPPQLPGNCPEPKQQMTWISFRGHCYNFMASRRMNWAHATVECIRMGASLLSVEDGLESQFIHKNLEILQDEAQSFWIGMHRSHEGNWMWIDNAVVDYTSWGPRMPGSHGDCVGIKSESGLWFTSSCSNDKSFICKTAKVIPPTEKHPDPTSTQLPYVEETPHRYTGTAVAVVLVIIAMAGLAAFLFFKRAPLPAIREFSFDSILYFNGAEQSTTTADNKRLVTNTEENV